MIKSIKAILAQDKEKFKVPRKVQDLIPIKNIWPEILPILGHQLSGGEPRGQREHVSDILGASEQLGQRSYHEDHHQ